MGAHKLGSIQQGIVFVCVRLSESFVFYVFQNETKGQRFNFAAHFKLFKKWSSFSFTIVSLRVSTNWLFRVLPSQVRNLPRNVYKNATLLSTHDPQKLPLCVPHPHLLLLIRFAFGFDGFYVHVKRIILETLENKTYTWRWHQILGRRAS